MRKGKDETRRKKEVSCSLTRPLRYDNISRAPRETSPKESRRHATRARGGFLCRRFFEREEELTGGEKGSEEGAACLFLPLALSFSRVLERKTRNTKQNRMLLGFCRAPPKPARRIVR